MAERLTLSLGPPPLSRRLQSQPRFGAAAAASVSDRQIHSSGPKRKYFSQTGLAIRFDEPDSYKNKRELIELQLAEKAQPVAVEDQRADQACSKIVTERGRSHRRQEARFRIQSPRRTHTRDTRAVQ